MQRKHLVRLVLVVIAFIGGVLLYAHSSGRLGNAGLVAEENQPGLYRVSRFVDGDTIVVDMNGQTQKVRFIGVDTPETHKPNTPVQCYGPQAAAFTKKTIGRHRVRLQSDPLSTDRDRYNRLLRYVYLPDGTNVDELLIQSGHGFYYPYFPFSDSKQFAADEKSAMSTHKGLWGSCHPTPTDQGGYVSNPQT